MGVYSRAKDSFHGLIYIYRTPSLIGGQNYRISRMKLYRKFTAERIFDGREFLTGDQALITTTDGEIADLLPAAEAGDDVEHFTGILSPGFINAHCHIELSHMKGLIPRHTGLVEFVRQVILRRDAPFPEDAALSPEELFEKGLDARHQAMNDAVIELQQSGTVAVGDISNSTDSVELKTAGRLHWHNFIELSGFVDAVATRRLEAARQVLRTFEDRLGKGSSTLTPHAAYSVSKTLFSLLNDATAGQVVSIHNQETADENLLYETKQGGFLKLYEQLGINIDAFVPTGKSSLQSWVPYLTKPGKIISVHNTFTSREDMDFVHANENFYWCVCANANLYIENKLPPLELLMQNPGQVVLGTDSYASNDALNILHEIKTIQENFPAIPLERLLQCATYNAAKALNIQDKFGSLTPGKRPGLVHILPGLSGSERII